VIAKSKKKGIAYYEHHWWKFLTAVPLHLGRKYSKTELFGQPLFYVIKLPLRYNQIRVFIIK
jgi:hypothetical protein